MRPPAFPIFTVPAGHGIVDEAFLEGKSIAANCEDALVITDDFVAVIDGMSSPLASGGGPRSGRLFALGVARAVQDLPSGIDARTAIDRITEALASITVEHSGPSGAVAAIYSRTRGEVWRVGDIHVAIAGQEHPGEKAVDVAYGQFRAAINAAQIAAGTSLDQILARDPGQEAAAELLRWQHHLANRETDYGYGVLNGTAVPTAYIEVMEVPSGASVILATDGYLGPAPSLEQAETELSAALRADPACIGELQGMGKGLRGRQAHPDDRTYVRLTHRGERA
ncbi:MAG: hypothetical protein Q4F65_02835 [Propionibacteriaceae bacterium]|nr:hypothetical protein [Propionibacteriaceae bacterium]